jgi:hypothetical protein
MKKNKMTVTELARIGGRAGRGDAKRRSRAHYRLAGLASAAARKILREKAKSVVVDAVKSVENKDCVDNLTSVTSASYDDVEK